MKFGASEYSISEAESKLGIKLPKKFIESLKLYNGLEYSEEWQLFSVFDNEMKSKSFRNDIVQANNNRFEYMDKKLIMIGTNGCGDYLVFNIDNPDEIKIWNHETNKIVNWRYTYSDIIKKSIAKVKDIEKRVNQSKDKK